MSLQQEDEQVHPNPFLKTYWGSEIRPEVFVAMSFADEYQSRFDDVIKPAIEAISHQGKTLSAIRVDLSASGDSILTSIVDGIAHSEIVVADVSTIGNDSKTGRRYRNGNVMYEVGVALACRQPSEVLLIRDDHDPFLFDVSTIPHLQIDFSDAGTARKDLSGAIQGRLDERDHINDARLQLAITTLTPDELETLRSVRSMGNAANSGFTITGNFVGRLVDKGLISVRGHIQKDGQNSELVYRPTRIGRVVLDNLWSLLPQVVVARVNRSEIDN